MREISKNNRTKENPPGARVTSETMKLKRIFTVREILTKQSDLIDCSECARYERDNRTKDSPHNAQVCVILIKESN